MSTAPSPATLFEAYLQLLSESYITFFEERQKVEKQYIAALTDLFERSKELSTIANNRLKTLPNTLSTTRAAWNEIINSLKQETDARILFLANLSKEIIPSLVALRDSHQEAFRGRQQYLEAVVEAHVSYIEGPLPALKRTYIKKSLELEELRETRGTSQLSPTETQTPSLSLPQQAGHLKQLITFVDKNGHTKESPSGATDVALLSMHAKREVDGADREYREGIRRSEGLRRARLAVVENICATANGFAYKLAATMRTVLGQYLSASAATGTTLSKICHSAWATAKNIDVTKDTGIPQDLKAKFMVMPRPCYYFNYEVGECRDLIFGTSLVDYANTKALSEGAIPKIVQICIQEVEKRGLDAEGIYQVSARHAEVQLLQHRMERNEEAFSFVAQDDDVYTISSLLKLYLKELPEPLFPSSLAERTVRTEPPSEMCKADLAARCDALKAKIQQLPAVHRATLGALVEHLRKVDSRRARNKMDCTKLAAIFIPLVFGKEQIPVEKTHSGVRLRNDILLEDLIEHAQIVFFEQSPSQPPSQQGMPPKLEEAQMRAPPDELKARSTDASRKQSYNKKPAAQSPPQDALAPVDYRNKSSAVAYDDSARRMPQPPPQPQSANAVAPPQASPGMRGSLPSQPGANTEARTDAEPRSQQDATSYRQKRQPTTRPLSYMQAPRASSYGSLNNGHHCTSPTPVNSFHEQPGADVAKTDASALGDSRPAKQRKQPERHSEESCSKKPMLEPTLDRGPQPPPIGEETGMRAETAPTTRPISRYGRSQEPMAAEVVGQSVMLRVTVLEARLSSDDIRPYVTVRIGSEEHRTTPGKSPNPRWQETFASRVIKGQSPILVQMFDYRVLSKDRLLGSANIDVWEHLLSKSSAEVECRVSYGWSIAPLKLVFTCLS